MARKTRPALPGLSRSTVCSKSCGRLAGHKGSHRGTLTATTKSSMVRPEVLRQIEAVEAQLEELRKLAKLPATPRNDEVVERGVEVHSADRYTVQAEPKARKVRRPKAVAQCRVVRDGVRCARAYGHKQAGKRHSFAGRIVQLPEVGPKGRDVQTLRTAKRDRYHASGRPSARLA